MTKMIDFIDNETQDVENRKWRKGVESTCKKHKPWNTNT